MPGEDSLYEAVMRWRADRGYLFSDLIRAASEALADGLDSPSLRALAEASKTDSTWDIRDLACRALEELGIRPPDNTPWGFRMTADGELVRRPGVDALRLEVATVPNSKGHWFQLRVYVNDVERTSDPGAGLGMDPYDVLFPTNHLVATSQPHTVPIARCRCGFYSCVGTDVTIVRDGNVVHWDWSREIPMQRGVSFAADRYDAEVARVAADLSWETPARTAGRLILTNMDRAHLLTYGLRPTAVNGAYPEAFRVTLQIEDDYQIFVKTPWQGRTPEQLASAICETLATTPTQWPATWHPIKSWHTTPPPIAGPSWHPEPLT